MLYKFTGVCFNVFDVARLLVELKRTCKRCGTEFTPSSVRQGGVKGSGGQVYCSPSCAYCRREGKTEANRAWRRANPEKYRTHSAVANALKDGRLNRSPFCQLCLSGGRIESHHQDYSRPLEVVWLCHFCHMAIEGRPVKFSAVSSPRNARPLSTASGGWLGAVLNEA